MLLRYIIRRSEYQGNVWSFISDVTYWKDRISFAMFHGLCDGLGLNRFIEAVLYHYFCLRDGRKYSDEGIYTERIPYDPAEETDIHSNLNLNCNHLRASFPPCLCLAAVNDALHRLPPLCLGRTKNLLRICLLLD